MCSCCTLHQLSCKTQASAMMFLQMFKTTIFLVIIWCCYFYRCHGCIEEERTRLLQIKDSINYPYDSSLDEDWVGKNCCKWYGVECNSLSSRVISIDLSSRREEGLGLWYPNASLFAAFKELEELGLGENHIGGWVAPQAFSEMQNLRDLNLSSNDLSASIYSVRGLCELKNLRGLYLGGNSLNGRSLPPCFSNLSMLEDLSLSSNDLGSNSSALTGLCGLSALRTLRLSYNYINDNSLPMCLGNFSLLENLYLSGNNLSGLFGNSISGLKRLRVLYLHSNHLSDDGISPWISNLTSLTTLWLQNNKLKGSDGLRGLKQLQQLNLDSNHLTDDSIFPWISNLTSLTALWLGNNSLKGSDTMRGLCGLSALRFLYLYDNHLSSLPICMGNFSSLEELYLFRNNLSGLFDSSVPGLKQLRILQLGSNHLTDDVISPWISNLTSLIELYLGNNTLKGSHTMRGAIPYEQQFSTFKESSYTNNHDLCGQPLQRNCSSNNRSQTQDGKGEEEDNVGILDHPMFFYLLVAISYALGFWSFIALLCNKNRRRKLFRIVDRFYD